MINLLNRGCHANLKGHVDHHCCIIVVSGSVENIRKAYEGHVLCEKKKYNMN